MVQMCMVQAFSLTNLGGLNFLGFGKYLGYVWFQEVLRKEKNNKKNDFLMFGFIM